MELRGAPHRPLWAKGGPAWSTSHGGCSRSCSVIDSLAWLSCKLLTNVSPINLILEKLLLGVDRAPRSTEHGMRGRGAGQCGWKECLSWEAGGGAGTGKAWLRGCCVPARDSWGEEGTGLS